MATRTTWIRLRNKLNGTADKDDENRTTSPLTGYDGLFYPDAAQDFLRIFWGEARDKQMDKFQIPGWFFINPKELYKQQKLDLLECFKSH